MRREALSAEERAEVWRLYVAGASLRSTRMVLLGVSAALLAGSGVLLATRRRD